MKSYLVGYEGDPSSVADVTFGAGAVEKDGRVYNTVSGRSLSWEDFIQCDSAVKMSCKLELPADKGDLPWYVMCTSRRFFKLALINTVLSRQTCMCGDRNFTYHAFESFDMLTAAAHACSRQIRLLLEFGERDLRLAAVTLDPRPEQAELVRGGD